MTQPYEEPNWPTSTLQAKCPNEDSGSNLTLHLLSLSDLGRETGLDSLDRTTRAARVAGDEVETVLSLV
jgi:hypothetical protein